MGDKIFFPNSAQFDTMNENLAKIAGVLGSQMDVSTWKGVQKAVRAGVAPELFPIGTQLVVSHSVYGDRLYDVVAHDYFKSAHDKNAHTMTLMCHDVISSMEFDPAEAFYYTENGISAGTYNFTLENTDGSWSAGTYQFTLPESLPPGTRLSISSNAQGGLVGGTVLEYGKIEKTYPISFGNEGTNLGTLGKELNLPNRVRYGSNNYKESAIRQFLNSNAEAGNWWKSQTKFDNTPVTEIAGFLNGLDGEFLSCVGEVIVPCSANNIYEAPDSTTIKGEKYTVVDKFYLASQTEIFGTINNPIADGSVQFPYYEGATSADRIKYRDGSAFRWRTRSADLWSGMNARIIDPTGSLNDAYAMYALGCVPVCTIV